MYSAQFLIGDSGLSGLFSALGIDWRSLILNGLAFLVIVWLLAKLVYPALIRAIDAKQAEITAAQQLEQKAKADLAKAQTAAEAIIGEARTAADQIVATARDDVAELLATSRRTAESQAERITAEARNQLAKDVNAARTALRAETARLVAETAGTILGEKLDREHDAKLIERTLELKR